MVKNRCPHAAQPGVISCAPRSGTAWHPRQILLARDQVLAAHQPRDLALSPRPRRLPPVLDLLRLNPVLMSQPHNRRRWPQPDPTAAGATASPAGSDVSSTPVVSPAVTSEPPARPATRLQHGISKPKVRTDGTVRWCQLASTSSDEPSSLAEAQGDPKWVAAMNLEHQALLRNQTWHLVTPSKGKNIVGCKWVYKVKRKADGTGMLGCAVSCSDLVLFLPKPTPLFSTTTRMGTISLFLSMLMILLLRVHPLKPQMHS